MKKQLRFLMAAFVLGIAGYGCSGSADHAADVKVLQDWEGEVEMVAVPSADQPSKEILQNPEGEVERVDVVNEQEVNEAVL